MQSIIVYTLGIKSALSNMNGNIDALPRASGIAFIACLLVTGAAGEVFYWAFDKPSAKGARMLFTWLLE